MQRSGTSQGDSALSAIAGGATYDTAELDITFVPTTSTAEFSFVFASEEYLEYVDSQFNDVFGGFVNGVDSAVVDKGFERVPATVIAINHLRNTLQFRDNTGGGTDAQANGMSTILRCRTSVHPGVLNILRPAIADTGDRIYDSWAFIQRSSVRAVTVPAPACRFARGPAGRRGHGAIGRRCLRRLTGTGAPCSLIATGPSTRTGIRLLGRSA